MEYGYTLEACHADARYPVPAIISFRLSQPAGDAIVREIWPDVDFLVAPGGASMRDETAEELNAIRRILGEDHYFMSFDPGRHRWHFHFHLV